MALAAGTAFRGEQFLLLVVPQRDPYVLSQGEKSLLTLFGAEHSLGGIAGYEVKETTDENPERVALIQQVTCAYLRHALGLEDADWTAARRALSGSAAAMGRIDSK